MKFHNERAPDSAALAYSLSPGLFTIDSGVNDITLYHGAHDIFNDSVCKHFNNVLPYGGIPELHRLMYSHSQASLLYSRIYRWQAYGNINSPELTNKAVMLAIRNHSLTYNLGITDKEHDSISVRPLTLRLSKGYFHPNYACDFSNPVFDSATQYYIRHALKDSTMDIQYYPGYSPSAPFGPSGSFSLNSGLGQFSFTAPDTGLYLVVLKIEEYRNQQLLGEIMSSRIAIVVDSNATLPVLSDPFAISGAVFNATDQSFTLCAGQSLQYKVKATSTLSDAQIIMKSDISQSAPGALVTYSGQSTDSVTMSFSWTPGPADNGFHYFYIDAVDTACGPGHLPVHQSKGILVHVISQVNIVSADSILCQGDSLTLKGEGGYMNEWSVVAGGDPYLPCSICDTVVVSPDYTTRYVLRTKQGSCILTDTFQVRVIPAFSIHANDTSFGGPVPSSYNLFVDVTPPAGYYSYEWTPADSVSSPTIPDPFPLNTNSLSSYVIMVSDSFDCFTVADTAIVQSNTSGVASIINPSAVLTISPNPATGMIMITVSKTFSASATAAIQLTDDRGRLVREMYDGKVSFLQQTQEFSLASLAPGIYLVRLVINGKPQRTEKLVVK